MHGSGGKEADVGLSRTIGILPHLQINNVSMEVSPSGTDRATFKASPKALVVRSVNLVQAFIMCSTLQLVRFLQVLNLLHKHKPELVPGDSDYMYFE